MHGSIPRKIARLALDLVRNPASIPRYLRETRKSPLELGLPWFSYAAIGFLDAWVRADHTVCEYGAGGSTVFFGRRAKSVTSIEDSASWLERTMRATRDARLTNVDFLHRTMGPGDASEFHTSPYLLALDRPHDVIIVDGTEDWPRQRLRGVCFERAEEFVRAGGIIVVDDSWRYPEIRARSRAGRIEIFKSIGPSRPGVTTTDVHFY